MSTQTMQERQYVDLNEAAAIWTEEKRALAELDGQDPATITPISHATARAYAGASLPSRKVVKKALRENPPPPATNIGGNGPLVFLPKDGQTIEELRAELRAWWRSRPGPKHRNGGPKPAGTVDPNAVHRVAVDAGITFRRPAAGAYEVQRKVTADGGIKLMRRWLGFGLTYAGQTVVLHLDGRRAYAYTQDGTPVGAWAFPIEQEMLPRVKGAKPVGRAVAKS